MLRLTSRAQLANLMAQPGPRGFIPTMGALHDGHLALVRAARERMNVTIASIFVNPLQFAPNEDLARYPRDIEGDCAKLEAAGVDAVYLPSVAEMYPDGFATFVDVGELGATFEGAIRPTHFRGVSTVVAKLLNIVAPNVLYLGQKDAQQTAVLQRMIRDLSFATRVVIVPTVRESDGLAMSSRNRYLDARQRAGAVTLHHAIKALADAMIAGATKSQARESAIAQLSPDAQLDYLDVVDANRFAPIEQLTPPYFVIGAVRFGTTRLLDNVMCLQ